MASLGVLVPLASPASNRSTAAEICLAPTPMAFGPETYVDAGRAGGEPVVIGHPNGTLIYAAHASTSLLWAPGLAGSGTTAYINHYQGQVYVWNSTDHGATWTFVPRDDIPNNVPASGFSDPDLAIDSAGQVYVSEINLLNVALSKSSDDGKSYALQNFFSQDLTDREWMDADGKNVVYMTGDSEGGGTSTKPVGNVGHTLYRSTDGGKTFTTGLADGNGVDKIRVDKHDGTLYEMDYHAKTLSMKSFRKARAGVLTSELHPIAKVPALVQSSFDLDSAGILHIAWTENGGPRAAGVYYSRSADGGRTWTPPLRVDRDDKTDYWITVAAGDSGRAGIAWFEADRKLPNNNPDTMGGYGWHVTAAQVFDRAGCGVQAAGLLPHPAISVSIATPVPFHIGPICDLGTACEAVGMDRRLGDYFTAAIDSDGRMVIAYSDTRKGGAVALPGFVRQVGGDSFRGAATPAVASPQPAKTPRVLGEKQRPGRLPGTGLADRGPSLAGALLLAMALLVRRSARRARRA